VEYPPEAEQLGHGMLFVSLEGEQRGQPMSLVRLNKLFEELDISENNCFRGIDYPIQLEHEHSYSESNQTANGHNYPVVLVWT